MRLGLSWLRVGRPRGDGYIGLPDLDKFVSYGPIVSRWDAIEGYATFVGIWVNLLLLAAIAVMYVCGVLR